MLYYILTFLAGFSIDSLSYKSSKNYLLLRCLFIIWLFVFLCFGYTNGSDWRYYEMDFYSNTYHDYDVGYAFLMQILKKVFNDFWLLYGLLKCAYLYSCIRVLKELTPRWLSSLSVMFVVSLLIMLIDCYLRFMLAMIFFNIAMILVLRKQYIIGFTIAVVSVFFHAASIICVAFLFFIPYNLFSRLKNWVLILIYFIILGLTIGLNSISYVQEYISQIFLTYNWGNNGYIDYMITSNEVVFGLGSVLNIFIFAFVLWTRKNVIRNSTNGDLLFSMTILYFYASRLFMVVPTGFRMAIPISFFYCTYISFIICHYKPYRNILILYFALLMTKNIWTTFVYLPYTNSIPYIISQKHLPFNKRTSINLDNYRERTGQPYNFDK